jgi:hypothetical protein
VQVLLGFTVLAVLQAHGTHYQVQILIETVLAHVLVHKELSFGCEVVPEAELGVVEPLLGVGIIFFIAYKEILNIPLGMLIILNEVILTSKSSGIFRISLYAMKKMIPTPKSGSTTPSSASGTTSQPKLSSL